MTLFKKISTGLAVSATAMIVAMAPASAKNFKIAVGDGGASAQEALGLAFIAALEEKSGGAHTGTLFMNGQLGSEQDTVNDMAIGTLDMSILASNNIAPFSPSVGVLSLPYIFENFDQAKTVTTGPIGAELTENTIRDAGVRILAWTYSGYRVLTNSERPVTTPADLAGLVIRVPKNEIMIDTYKSWGIEPTPMAWNETFAALQTGTVKGQDTPLITINAMKFYEVQKYLTNIHYLFLLEPLAVSESVFQELSAEEQTALLEAGKEATAASEIFLKEKEAEIQAKLVTEGMEISEPADGEKAFIEAATSAVWPKFYESVGGIEKVNAILEATGRAPVSE